MDVLRKKLIYRSLNRGCRENDFLLKAFAEQEINELSLQELETLDSFLQESDPDIFIWISKNIDVPKQYQMLINRIRCKHFH